MTFCQKWTKKCKTWVNSSSGDSKGDIDFNLQFKDSSDDEFEMVRVLPSAKRVKMMADTKAKAETKSETEESDSTEDSESD